MSPRLSRSVHLTLLSACLCLPAIVDARSVNPKHLKVAKTQAVYTLTEPYTFQEKAATFTLKPGTYIVRFESASHEYLIGQPNCLEVTIVPPKQPDMASTSHRDCGIELPKDATRGATFFSPRQYIPPNPEMPWYIDAIVAYGEGSFMFWSSRHRDLRLRTLLTIEPTAAAPTEAVASP